MAYDDLLNFGTLAITVSGTDVLGLAVLINGTQRSKNPYLRVRSTTNVASSGTNNLIAVAQVSDDGTTWNDRSETVPMAITATAQPFIKYLPVDTKLKYVRLVARTNGIGTPSGVLTADFSISDT